MIDLIDISHGTTHPIAVEHRSFDIFYCRQSPDWNANVENADLPAAADKLGQKRYASTLTDMANITHRLWFN